MKKGFLLPAAMLSAILALSACGNPSAAPAGSAPGPDVSADDVSYKVYLPADYDENRQYPTLYVMPYDGYSSEIYYVDDIEGTLEDLMAGEEVTDMIVVFPEFSEGDNYKAELNQIVALVDDEYATIPDRSKRGIIGVNVGGFMAYDAALTEENKDNFFAVGSHMGNFVGEDNPWYTENTDVSKAVQTFTGGGEKGYNNLLNQYFYIDAPNEEADTTKLGGSTTIGAALEKTSNPYWQYGGQYYMSAQPDLKLVEYAVLDGAADSDYYLTNLSRSMNRFSQAFVGKLTTGTVTANPTAVSPSDETVKVHLDIAQEDMTVFAEADSDVLATEVTLTTYDAEDGTEIASETISYQGSAIEYSFDREELSEDNNTIVKATAEVLGYTFDLGETTLVKIAEATDDAIDLMGNWYFQAYKGYKPNDKSVEELDQVANITPEVYGAWEQVQPCLGWWDEDFAPSLKGQANYEGYAWYVREFEVPEDFAAEDLVAAVGKFDEANEVYINGKLVGSTGMLYDVAEGIGVYDGSNPWDADCVYDLDASVLNMGGTNTIAIRMCNSSGGGGWYEGPVGIFTRDALDSAGDEEKLLTKGSYTSKATGSEETYRIYLPENYDEETDKNYPVLYLLHGINSSSKSFEIDGIAKVLNEAMATDAIEDIIVVMPDDPTKQSFWAGEYGKMVTEDLVAHIDSTYRTVADKAYRYIAGCSMGGAGSVGLGLTNPDLFSGIISFYGAFEYVDGLATASKMDAETLSGFKIYMICGNEDLYNFYDAQELMSGILTAKGVDHYHMIDCGGHTSSFYLPHFVEAIQYIMQ